MTKSSDDGGPGGSTLPQCLEDVRSAATALEEAVFSLDFPDLTAPATDEDATEIAAAVIRWGREILRLYEGGFTADQERGLLQLLAVPDPPRTIIRESPQEADLRDACRALAGAAQALNRGSVSRWEQHDIHQAAQRLTAATSHPIRTSVNSAPGPVGPPSMERASDILGPVPEPYRRSFAKFETPPPYDQLFGTICGRHPYDGIRVTVENWHSAREVIRERHALVVSQCLGLVNWVRIGIAALDDAFLPRIVIRCRLKGGKVRIAVSCAGQTREVDTTPATIDALRTLQERGEVDLPRATRSRIVGLIPELRPWLKPHPTKTARQGSRAVYVVPDQIRRGIDLPAD